MSDPRIEGMDHPGRWAHPGALDDWPTDDAGAITVPALRRRLAPMLERGRPYLIYSVDIAPLVAAALDDDLGPAVDTYSSLTMPGDTRVLVFSPEARAAAGI